MDENSPYKLPKIRANIILCKPVRIKRLRQLRSKVENLEPTRRSTACNGAIGLVITQSG